MKFVNNSKVSFLGTDLIKKIYARAYRLDANVIIVNNAKYNRYAEIELFEDEDCIDEHIDVFVS